MNVKSVEKQEKSAVELVIEIGGEEFEAAVQKAYLKQRNKINVPGFRKGKAPRKIIEGMFGSGVFYEDAINELYPKAYADAVEQEKLDVVSWPNVEVLEAGKDGLTFKATVTVRPEVKLGEYKGLTAEKEEVKITDEDIDNELKPYINRASRMVTVEREAQNGDTVVIDFEGFKDGVPFDGGKAEGHSLELGSGAFIPGFEDQLVGTKAGDEKDVNVTFPEDYHAEDLAGAPVVFKVKVHEVKEKQLPTVDDEFAKDVSEFDTLEAFKKDLADKLTERREAQARQYLDNFKMQLAQQGIQYDQYMKATGMDEAKLIEDAKEPALKQVRMDLAMAAIIKEENIDATDEEVEAEFQKMADQYGMDLETVKKYLHADQVKDQLKSQKAIAVVTDSATAAKPEKKPAKKSSKKAEETAEGEEAAEEKPAKKTTRKKAEKAEEDGEEKKPAKKSTKKAAKKEDEEPAESK